MTHVPLSTLHQLVAALAVVSAPGAAYAQQAHFTWPRLEVRGGIAGHGAGDCHVEGTSAATVGVDLRTHGRWIASAAVDGFLYGSGCLDIGYGTRYQGQWVDIEGWPFVGPRMSLSLGYGFTVFGVRTEVGGGLGAVLTRTDYGRGGEFWDWRPWHGGTLTARLRSSLAFQFELGRHQLAERYYLMDQDVLVAEFLRWERMWRLGVSFPVLG